MSVPSPPALDASLRIVIVTGKEALLVEQATARLREALRAEHGEIDEFRLDGNTVELADVLDELRSYALLQQHKLVVVDDADKFLSRAERHRRALEEYAASPVESATLLLRAATWRPGRLDKLVDKIGRRVKCEPPRDYDAVAWCVERSPATHEAAIDPDAAQLLVARIGPDLARLDAELGKLAAYAGDRASITREDVGELVARSRQEQAWALQSALLSGSAATAVRKLRELLEISKVPEELAMWAIADLVRRVHTACRLLDRGVPPAGLRKELRLFGPDGQRIIDTARRGDARRLAQLLRQAVETDRRTKTGWGKAPRNLEALAIEVADTIG